LSLGKSAPSSSLRQRGTHNGQKYCPEQIKEQDGLLRNGFVSSRTESWGNLPEQPDPVVCRISIGPESGIALL